KGEVRKMLMIDGVELIVLDQAQEMRKLHGDHPGGCQHDPQPLHEIVEIRNMRENVVSHENVGEMAFRGHSPGLCATEKAAPSRNTTGHGGLRDIRGRFDAQDLNAMLGKILKQISVIAGHLDDLRFGRELTSSDHHEGVRLDVLEPALRVGGKIGIVAEQMLRTLELV